MPGTSRGSVADRSRKAKRTGTNDQNPVDRDEEDEEDEGRFRCITMSKWVEWLATNGNNPFIGNP